LPVVPASQCDRGPGTCLYQELQSERMVSLFKCDLPGILEVMGVLGRIIHHLEIADIQDALASGGRKVEFKDRLFRDVDIAFINHGKEVVPESGGDFDMTGGTCSIWGSGDIFGRKQLLLVAGSFQDRCCGSPVCCSVTDRIGIGCVTGFIWLAGSWIQVMNLVISSGL
jgi:hypothetical protein